MEFVELYLPLATLWQEIRLVTLLPGPKGSSICCGLRVVTLRNSDIELQFRVDYAALSYEWGDPGGPSKEIMLKGHPFTVRENLWLALEALRSETEILMLWIDAICINQDDTAERNHQVSMMNIIYTEARRVHIWLGPTRDESKEALDLLEKVGNPFKGLFAFSEEVTRDSWDERWTNLCTNPEHLAGWRGLAGLMDRSYWSRLWIVQEFLLPIHTTLHCGSHSIDGTIFNGALHNLMARTQRKDQLRFPGEFQVYLERILASPGMKMSEKRGMDCHYRTLVDLIDLTKKSKASDPRDRIYAILGLATDISADQILIDYNRSIFKLKMDVVWFYQTKPNSSLLQDALLNGRKAETKVELVSRTCRLLDEVFQDCENEDD